jgi:hypothetical protein
MDAVGPEPMKTKEQKKKRKRVAGSAVAVENIPGLTMLETLKKFYVLCLVWWRPLSGSVGGMQQMVDEKTNDGDENLRLELPGQD